MDTKILVGKFIHDLKRGQIFITRECLTFGERAAVDTVLWNLVNRGVLVRLANGVFVRNDIGMKMPTLAEIVKAKARAHVRCAIPLGTQLSSEHNLVPKPRRKVKNMKAKAPGEERKIVASYAVLGDTTTFNTMYGRVEFRRTPARKYCLANNKFTRILAAWWASIVGQNFSRLIANHISRLGKIEKKRFKELGAWAPAWISDQLLDKPPQFLTRAPKTIYPPWTDDDHGKPDFDQGVREPTVIYHVRSSA